MCVYENGLKLARLSYETITKLLRKVDKFLSQFFFLFWVLGK